MSARKDMFRSAPVLQVKDVLASGKFYTETLGFDSAAMSRFSQ